MNELEKNGFIVHRRALPNDFFEKNRGLTDLDFLVLLSPPEDVFNTEFGPKQIQNLHHLPIFKSFANVLTEKAGMKNYKILNMQAFIKYPGYKITSPHQDGAYFNSPERKILTFWVPIQDVKKEDSCMHYLSGSHKDGLLEHSNIGTTIRTRTGATGLSMAYNDVPLENYIPVEMEVGDILIHDQLCLQKKKKNEGIRPRIALTLIIELE